MHIGLLFAARPEREAIVELLQFEGLVVTILDSASELLGLCQRNEIDVAVIDAGLADHEAFGIVRTLHSSAPETPMIVAGVREDELDAMFFFEIGADDYIAPPLAIADLLGRIKAVARRTKRLEPAKRHVYGPLEIDENARDAKLHGTPLRLRPREFALLLALAENYDVALSRTQLLDLVWGSAFAGDERVVDGAVRRLRSRFEGRFRLEDILVTVHGLGYKFCPTFSDVALSPTA